MSSPLPPPPAGPAGFGSPLQTGAPLAPGGSPAKKRSPLPWIIGAVVLVVAAIIVIVLLTRGDDDGSGIDAEGASAGMAAVIDDADFDDTGSADLRRCPMSDAADLTEQIAEQIDASDELIDGEPSQAVEDATDVSPALIACTLSAVDDADGPTSVEYLANPVPRGDYGVFLEEVFGDGADVDIDDPVDGSGGVFYSYCAQPEGGDEACGADWVDEEHDLVLGFYVLGDRLDGDAAREALEEILATMADGLADQG